MTWLTKIVLHERDISCYPGFLQGTFWAHVIRGLGLVGNFCHAHMLNSYVWINNHGRISLHSAVNYWLEWNAMSAPQRTLVGKHLLFIIRANGGLEVLKNRQELLNQKLIKRSKRYKSYFSIYSLEDILNKISKVLSAVTIKMCLFRAYSRTRTLRNT